jgi:hypothetical protein
MIFTIFCVYYFPSCWSRDYYIHLIRTGFRVILTLILMRYRASYKPCGAAQLGLGCAVGSKGKAVPIQSLKGKGRAGSAQERGAQWLKADLWGLPILLRTSLREQFSEKGPYNSAVIYCFVFANNPLAVEKAVASNYYWICFILRKFLEIFAWCNIFALCSFCET